MNTHDKKSEMTLTFVEAVETLSHIVDLKFESEVDSIDQNALALPNHPLIPHTVHQNLHGLNITVEMIKEIFTVILNYFQNSYKNNYSHVPDIHTVEGIKTIMVLIGEAAKKLDKYTTLFHKAKGQSVTTLKEYKQIQEFYINRIAKKIDQGTIGKWILALARKEAVTKHPQFKSFYTKHVFMDLESVKKDTEYELFFLKKEDGTRFFSPRLIRNIKLVNDFGHYLREENEDERLINMEDWQDKFAFTCAKNIIKTTRGYCDKFCRVARQSKNLGLVEGLNHVLIALMMAGNPHHLHNRTEFKSCRHYFRDFQHFLRSCLKSADYQKLMAYPPEKSSKLAWTTVNLIHFICLALYTQLTGYQEFLSPVHSLIYKASEKQTLDHKETVKDTKKLWKKLDVDYAAMQKFFKNQGFGPLNKILNLLEEGECNQFDPLFQSNLPSQLYTLYVQEKRFQFARWPSPTYQEFIHKAAINEEFKAFLNACSHQNIVNKILIFNFQDRLTWKEHFRCEAIEDLPNHESFSKHIETVCLTKDTEFYHQLAPYHLDNHAANFIHHFKEQIQDENGGFLVPQALKKELFNHFIPLALEEIHRIFFSGKNMLLRESRLDFIEIFYLFLELKIIEYSEPDIVSFICKDGLDVSLSGAAELFVFLKFLNQERLSENDQENLDLMLYGPCLISRERMMIPDRFHRMVNALKAIEEIRQEFGQAGFSEIICKAFGHLYKTPIFKGKIIIQNNKDIF